MRSHCATGRLVRVGWAEEARKIAEAGEDALVMGEFGNMADAELVWRSKVTPLAFDPEGWPRYESPLKRLSNKTERCMRRNSGIRA
jgi:hypothetical protein